MTPETRAARDRITLYLQAATLNHPNHDGEIDTELGPNEGPRGWVERPLLVNDLRTVLAALDETDDPEAGWKPGDIR